jgi:hypothetical protein
VLGSSGSSLKSSVMACALSLHAARGGPTHRSISGKQNQRLSPLTTPQFQR